MQFDIYPLRSLIHGVYFFLKKCLLTQGLLRHFVLSWLLFQLASRLGSGDGKININANPGANSQYKSSGNHTSNFKLELSLTNLN